MVFKKQRQERRQERQNKQNEGDEKPTSNARSKRGVAGRYAIPEKRSFIWLVSFTDVMALMLTFFVLLFAMSEPEEKPWEAMTSSILSELNRLAAGRNFTGSADAISIDQLDVDYALDLDYLQALLSQLMERNKALSDVSVIRLDDSIALTIPSDLLFDIGKAELRDAGKKLIDVLSGSLSRIKNRMEVYGHTDPTPTSGERYSSNWHLSMARASTVASVFYKAGYTRNMTMKGFASGRINDLSGFASLEDKYRLNRRVDLVIFEDDGRDIEAF